MNFHVDRAFVRVFQERVRELMQQRGWVWQTPENSYWIEVEDELTTLFNEAEAWAFIERSMRHYASRA